MLYLSVSSDQYYQIAKAFELLQSTLFLIRNQCHPIIKNQKLGDENSVSRDGFLTPAVTINVLTVGDTLRVDISWTNADDNLLWAL